MNDKVTKDLIKLNANILYWKQLGIQYPEQSGRAVENIRMLMESLESLIADVFPEIQGDFKNPNLLCFSGIKGNAFHYLMLLNCRENFPKMTAPPMLSKDKRQLESRYTEAFYQSIIGFLFELGVDINAEDSFFKQTPLCSAIGFDNVQGAKALLNYPEKKLDLNKPCQAGYGSSTPLILAIQRGHAEIVKLLVQKGADLNKPDKYGLTPLHWCAIMLDTESAKFLLDSGAKIEKSLKDKTPLDYLYPDLSNENYFDEINKQLETDATKGGSASHRKNPEFRPVAAHFWNKTDHFVEFLKEKVEKEAARENFKQLLENVSRPKPAFKNPK